MRNISLLPAELKSYKKSVGRISKIVMAVIILILVFVLAYVWLSFEFLRQERELAQVRLKRAEVGLKIAQLQHYDDIAAEISALEGKLKQAMGDNPLIGELASQISASFPSGAQMIELSIDYMSGDSKIKMKGLANSHVYVADFLANLEALDILEGVTCKNSLVSDEDGNSVVMFEINAEIAGLENNEAPAGGGGER